MGQKWTKYGAKVDLKGDIKNIPKSSHQIGNNYEHFMSICKSEMLQF